jgi:hypothetical protein
MARVEEMCHSFLTSILDACECCPKVWSLILIKAHFLIITKHNFGTVLPEKFAVAIGSVFAGEKAGRLLSVTSNRCIPVKNTLD